MLVRMKVGMSGPLYTLNPGDEFHFPDDEAKRLIEADFAVEVEDERADKPTSTRRKKGSQNVVSTESDDPAGE